MIEIRLVLTDAGQLQIQGQIENAIVCYGMLEMAKLEIAKHHAAQAQRLVQPAAAVPLLGVNGGRHGA